MLSIIPFLTFSVILNLITPSVMVVSPVTALIDVSIGRMMGIILFTALLLIELIFYTYSARRAGVFKVKTRQKENASNRVLHDMDTVNPKREFILNLNRINRDKSGLQEIPEGKEVELFKLEKNKGKAPGNKKIKIKVIPPLKEKNLIEDAGQAEKKLIETGKVRNKVKKDQAVDAEIIEDTIEDTIEEVMPVSENELKLQHLLDQMKSENRENGQELVPVKQSMMDKKFAEMKKLGTNFIPVEGILDDYEKPDYWTVDQETKKAGTVLMETLEEFKINAEVTGIQKGPVITMFEILPAPGVKLSRIVNLADNIALRLAASRVRIVAPIPGKHAVGIEIPNKKRAIVSFKELILKKEMDDRDYEIPLVIGKDITGGARFIDLVQTPHLLIAGATGSGKSVCVNSIICSILYKRTPQDVRILLIDPKIVELKFYNDIPHLLTPVVTDPKRAFQALQYCIYEMERRYSLFDAVGVRDIRSYNKKAKAKKLTINHLPYLVVVIDEFADLIATTGKEMEATIARLAAMSRAVGIHLVLATQRPSVEVITGLIKANIPSRIAFMVASKFDSRIIIDSVGAEKLLGKGDMLLCPAWDPVPDRIQGSFLSEEEVEKVTNYVKTLGEPEYIDEDIFFDEDAEEEDGKRIEGSDDPLMDKALEILVAKGKISASFLQRRLKIGYNRAARLVEHMEIRGIVGPANGSKPRELLHIPDTITSK
ncbi:MAG: DUF87 domain-containing protein [Spirochaetales bacterium]|nr:DUF87 domain-containing protein [Spirochaetales bacterium]